MNQPYKLAWIARNTLLLLFGLVLVGCAAITVAPYERPAPEYAVPAAPQGVLSEIEAAIYSEYGPDVSGFELLDSNEDGLVWRLALIDSATQSIDIQYYLWYGDTAGRLLAKRLLDAADRGVKVRILVDDLNTVISDASTVALGDRVAAMIEEHPGIELRLFNPWTSRDLGGRLGESLSRFERVNQRMHNKSLIVDNRAAIIGGRNIGDEYMGLHAEFNFHDLDVLGIGPVARQASEVFDEYWNSEWVMPVSALKLAVTDAEQNAAYAQLLHRLEEAGSLANFELEPKAWSAEFANLQERLHPGTSEVDSDYPEGDIIGHVMLQRQHEMMLSAQEELLIVNAYIIPAERGISLLHELGSRGVDMNILTNSLASHDVPAVNSHYKKWRKPLLETGAKLYEMRHDAAIQPLVSDTPPTQARFMGLHSKGMVVDREHVYIGSMNYDPRSALLNTEMGVFIKSRGLGEALAELIERDMRPANSWQVKLEGHGSLRWVHDQKTVTRQPARSWWQRVQDVLFMAFPKEYY
jgi:putative cardiolipin synthase